MSGVKFGNAKKAWQFFPDNTAKLADPKPTSGKIKISRKTCAMLIAMADMAGQRLINRVVQQGEVPTDPITSFANELLSLMRENARAPKSFKFTQDHHGDHIAVECALLDAESGQHIIASSTLLDLNDATSMIATGLCCLSRVYGRGAIEPFVGAGNIHLFPCETDLVLIGAEGDDPYDLFNDFGEVLIFDDANLNELNKEWLFDAFTDEDDQLVAAPLGTVRKDRD